MKTISERRLLKILHSLTKAGVLTPELARRVWGKAQTYRCAICDTVHHYAKKDSMAFIKGTWFVVCPKCAKKRKTVKPHGWSEECGL